MLHCQVTEIGKIGNFEVKAVTDAIGPQVIVIDNEKTYLSQAQQDHNAAIELGKQVWEGEIDYINWDGPVDDFISLMGKMYVQSIR